MLPILSVLAIPLAHYRNGWNWEKAVEYAVPVTISSFLVLGVIPNLIMHLTHYFSNRNLSILIECEEKKIRIQKDLKFSYKWNELTIILNTPIYHKNKVDNRNRWETPWSNYSFFTLITPDNKEFNISSIVLSPSELPIEPTEIKYSLWPSIKPWYVNRQIEIDCNQKHKRERINGWKQKFSDLTVEELKSMLGRPKDYDELPKIAMEELLKEKVTDIC
ncbi:hypothetical protein C9994_02065 [Marivirga lumbricoides]|uniref:PH domain-containing protein n=1 Tax=Marivirga lumbricoides TaxID=1046115 RepID=A0A2T4DUZ3_9BACT|nr:hypothetical protein C9994_02065 [Marivirga lumbricoides]